MDHRSLDDALRKSLASSNAAIRLDAVATLAHIYTTGGSRDREIAAVLDGLAHYDTDDRVRQIAGTALGWDARLLDAIAAVFNPSDTATRLQAITTLRYYLTQGKEVEVLLAHEWLARLAHHDEDEQVRDAANQALPKTDQRPSTGYSESELRAARAADVAPRGEPAPRRRTWIPWLVGLFIGGMAIGVILFSRLSSPAVHLDPLGSCVTRINMISAGGAKVMFQDDPRQAGAPRLVEGMDGKLFETIDRPGQVDSLDLAPDGVHILESRREEVYPYYFIYSWMESNFAQWNERMLTYGQYPSWSPDMKRIAFFRFYSFDRSALFVMNADGSDVRNIRNTRYVNSPASWSPDGRRLAISTSVDATTSHHLLVLNLADHSETALVSSGLSADWPAWSPDGKSIAYVTNDIYTINADGSNRRNLTDGKFNDVRSPDWSPDSMSIAFLARGPQYSQAIYIMDSDGKGIHSIYTRCPG